MQQNDEITEIRKEVNDIMKKQSYCHEGRLEDKKQFYHSIILFYILVLVFVFFIIFCIMIK